MSVYRVEVYPKNPSDDATGAAVLNEIRQLGFNEIYEVASGRIFLLQGDDQLLTPAQVEKIASQVLCDPVSERYVIGAAPHAVGRLLEVHLKPGVMDPVAASTQAAVADKLQCPPGAVEVRTGRRFLLLGQVTADTAMMLGRRVLANESIEELHTSPLLPDAFPVGRPYPFKRVEVPIRQLSREELQNLSRTGHLFLDASEMAAIQSYFQQIGRDPTDAELETLAQTWSEHCVHKTLKAIIEFTHHPGTAENEGHDHHGPGDVTMRIDNLVKSTIFRATKELNLPWTLSVFKDNAGVIAFDEGHALCMKVETHNRPSAIEPYGGAATGIGGCIRDVIGTGGGAMPIAATDVFCFADPDTPESEVPAGVIHPRRTARRVVAGVRDYGNRMGVPTVNGAVFFDSRYIGNPLVFCGSVGLLPLDQAQKGAARKGDRIVVLGGRTGRDGIHGATFSSDVLTDKHGEQFSHAVQIGNAITEKKMLDVILAARDNPGGSLFHAITDCGAGGLSSAVGEMGSETGAAVYLDRAPLKYDGLGYAEIWISEAQERMVLAVPPDRLSALKSLAAHHDVEAVDIGEFDGSGRLKLYYHGNVVGDMDMHFIHEGLPKPVRKAIWEDPSPPSAVRIAPPADLGRVLHDLLSTPTIASKHWIIRQYDHEVQGGTVIKPLVGPGQNGPGDAAVIMPVAESQKAAALAVGCQPRFGDLNPYQMALNSMDEAIRNIVCVGGNPDRIALLDNFCWPKCSDRIHLGALVRACQACYDGAIAFRTPFISGKDSLSNEFITEDGTRICIPYTLLISAIGIVDDVARCITMDAKKAGHRLVLVGLTRRELGGSHYLMLQNHLGRNVPTVDLAAAPQVHQAVGRAISRGLVRSAHDLSEGGLGVALAEMLLAGELGARVKLASIKCPDDAREDHVLLFSETPTRYLLEVAPSHLQELQSTLGDIPMADIGELTHDPRLIIESLRNEVLIDESVEALEKSWRKPLDW